MHESAYGPKRRWRTCGPMSDTGAKADVACMCGSVALATVNGGDLLSVRIPQNGNRNGIGRRRRNTNQKMKSLAIPAAKRIAGVGQHCRELFCSIAPPANNLLEMSSYDVTPEDGVTRYQHDQPKVRPARSLPAQPRSTATTLHRLEAPTDRPRICAERHGLCLSGIAASRSGDIARFARFVL